MTWLQHCRGRDFFRNFVLFPPLLGMAAALLMHPMLQWVDAMVGWKTVVGPDSARAVLGARVPIILTSRAGSVMTRFASYFVAVPMAKWWRESGTRAVS